MIEFERVRDSKDFQNVYNKAKKWHCDGAVVYFLAGSANKFSAVASKKIGKAVARNRAKRRIRAAFSNIKDELNSGTYIIIARAGINELSFKNIEKNLRWSFKKIEALK